MKISQLAPLTSLTRDCYFPLIQTGVTKRVTLGSIIDYYKSISAPIAIPRPSISIAIAGQNPPEIVIAPDTYLPQDHLILRIYDNADGTGNLIIDDHILSDDEYSAQDVTFAKLTSLPAGKHYYDLECIRAGVSGGRSIQISDTVASLLVAPKWVDNDSTGMKPSNNGYTAGSFAGGGRYPFNVANPKSSGKLYAEITITNYVDALLFGFAAAGQLNQNQFPGYSASPTFCAGAGGNPWKAVLNGNNLVDIAQWGTGGVAAWAFDFDNNKAYLRYNGVWVIGNGDTGQNGIDISARGSTPVYLTVTVGATGADSDRATLTATTTPPSGYVYWD